MKKVFYTLLLSIGLLSPLGIAAGSAAAVDVFQPCTSTAQSTEVCSDVNDQNSKDTNPIIGTLKVLLEILSFIAGVVAVVMLVIAGFRFVTANGDSNNIKSARESVLYVLVGIVVIVASQTIVVFVLNKI